MKDNVKNLIKFIIFITFTYILILKVGEVFIPENILKDNIQGQTITTKGFYELPKNSIDVLFVGDSSLLNSVSPMEMWNKEGITSYNHSNSSIRTYGLYYVLEDALKTQSPKVVVIDTDTMFFYYKIDEPLHRAHIDHLTNSISKFKLVNNENYEFTFEDKVSSFLPLLRYHSRWQELKIRDFSKLTRNYESVTRGFVMAKTVKPSTRWQTYMNEYDENVKFENDSPKYLEKIYELCHSKGITLMLMQAPNTRDWGKSQSKYIQEYADKLGVNFLDFNTVDFGLNWNEDTKDGGVHMNVLGALKLTDYLTKYLKDNYDLPDHRNEKEYEYWNLDYEVYKKELDNFVKDTKDIINKKG